MVYLKMDFFADNLIRQKAYEEYDGVKSFSQYIKTKHGKEKLKQLVRRYFKAIGLDVQCLDIDTDFLVNDEILIVLADNNYTMLDYNSGHIYFYNFYII